jgi:hypothetical protein
LGKRKMKMKPLILIGGMILGLAYGGLSGVRNQNPYYVIGDQMRLGEAERGVAWGWKPSAVWLPSYLLCKVPINGFGISHTRSGYLFRTEADRRIYLLGSAIAGAAMGLLVTWLFVANRGRKPSIGTGTPHA